MSGRTLMMENARIGFRNFSGKEGKYNPPGRKNFCVFLEKEENGHRVIDDDLTAALVRDGWNVRYLEPRDEEEPRMPYLQVAVRYDNIPPKIVLITSNGKTELDENMVKTLDFADIRKCDLVINPSQYNVNGRSGIKAYCKELWVTIEESEFEKKYRDVPDSALNSMVDDSDDIPF